MKIEDLKEVSNLIDRRQEIIFALNVATAQPHRIRINISVPGWNNDQPELDVMRFAAVDYLDPLRADLRKGILIMLEKVEQKLRDLGVDAREGESDG